MPYPPATLASDKDNQTLEFNDHPTHHNALATAVNDIVTELGTNPSGASATVGDRFVAIEGGKKLFTQATAPSATAGDVWVDTSATPARIYRKT